MKIKLANLEGFLKDYGLRWTGEKGTEIDTKSVNMPALKRDLNAKEIYRNKLPEKLNMDHLKRSIDWLNCQVMNSKRFLFF